ARARGHRHEITRYNRHMWMRTALLGAIGVGVALGIACGTDETGTFVVTSDGGVPEETGTSVVPPPPDATFIGEDAAFSDFPATPIIDTPDGGAALPPNIADLFGAAASATSGGPCLVEPEIGSMYPRNWLRPRFRWVADQAYAPLY